jgi:hypothetical protein
VEGEPGAQRALKHALLQAYQGEGRNPSDASVLLDCASQAGLDATRAAQVLQEGTYTAWNGTSTITNIQGDSFSVIVVRNSAAMGATPALATSTYGPYTVGLYNGTATGTQTTVAGAYVAVGLGTATGAAAPVPGGFTVNQGDTVHIVRGTDATAVVSYAMEYGITPLANVTL